jgi:hypothetical protein
MQVIKVKIVKWKKWNQFDVNEKSIWCVTKSNQCLVTSNWCEVFINLIWKPCMLITCLLTIGFYYEWYCVKLYTITILITSLIV